MTDRIVAFYSGGTDDRGRTLEDILCWPDDRLEAVHDFIQWVFPTEAPSAVNPFAPLVTSATIAEFAARPELRDRLRAALDRMLAFYGLARQTPVRLNPDTTAADIVIDPDRFPARSRAWLRPGNHNHFRLTRIMQSLWALGLRDEASALQGCLTVDVCEGPGPNRITRDTYEFWLSALTR